MAEAQSQTAVTIGIEISSSMLTGVCLDASGAIARTFRKELDGEQGVVEQVASLISEAREAGDDVAAVGVAVPGLVHRDSRRIAFSAHNPAHADVDIVEGIKERTGLRSVVENDANAAAYGEFRLGAGRGSHDLFYATLGAGVGGAFIFDGAIWSGKAGFAGEFGYIAINSEGMRLEDVASAANIVRRTRNRMLQDSTSSLSTLDPNAIGIAEIVAAAESEDDLAKLMLERTGEYVGTAVASVINLLNVETVVLGGELMETGHLVLDSVISRARELSFGPSFSGTRILAGTLGRNAAATGAALIAAGR